MTRRALLAAVCLLPAAGAARAQSALPGFAPSPITSTGAAVIPLPPAPNPLPSLSYSTSTVTVSTFSALTEFGYPLSMERGPWVLGDVLFRGLLNVSDVTLRDRIRARRGMLFTPSDIQNDVSAVMTVPGVLSAEARLYAMPDQPVPESYRTISVSTMMARVVYTVAEKQLQLPGLTPLTTAQAGVPLQQFKEPPAPVSGVVMTPTAYRGIDQYNQPGLGLDFDGEYIIGRLYGKNSLDSVHSTNYLDRIGVWFLTADGKMQLQSEGTWRPAVSAGTHGILTFRDAPQPSINTPSASVSVSAKTTRALSDGYIVASKNLFHKVRTSFGFAEGNAANRVGLLTEFLSPQSLQFLSGYPQGYEPTAHSAVFGSLLYLPKPSVPLAVELYKPNGMALNPLLINLKVGYYLKLNFDLAYLKFQGGWDALGLFQFRYTQFPRTYRPTASK